MQEELAKRGGRIVAISVDAPELSRRVKSANRLPFSILADPGAQVIRRCGLLHAGGGPRGTDIAMPATLLAAADGQILWRYQSAKVQERAAVPEILAAIAFSPANRPGVIRK